MSDPPFVANLADRGLMIHEGSLLILKDRGDAYSITFAPYDRLGIGAPTSAFKGWASLVQFLREQVHVSPEEIAETEEVFKNVTHAVIRNIFLSDQELRKLGWYDYRQRR